MNIKEKFSEYLTKKSKLGIASDVIFIVFIVLLIIPSTRIEVVAALQKIRVAIIQPSVEDEEKAIVLSQQDYAWMFSDLEGNQYRLGDFKGKVLFVNLWATWCPPCVAEMPSIQKLYDKFKDNQQIKFLIISSETKDKVEAFVTKRGFTFPVKTTPYQLPDALYTQSIPTTFLISKQGKIVVKEVGAANWGGDKMEKIVKKLLNE